MPTVGGMYYAETGAKMEAAAPPILLIHGSGGSHLDWPGSLRRIVGRRVLTLDLPGHGRSTPPGRETAADYAADVIGLLDALAIDTAIVAGHSLGGAIALQLALSHPERIAGLNLVGTGARLRVHSAILDHILPEPVPTAALIVQWEYAPGTSQAILDRSQRQLLKSRASSGEITAPATGLT
jgi:pimeloyl-ACP methyl ester carboxylesterase